MKFRQLVLRVAHSIHWLPVVLMRLTLGVTFLASAWMKFGNLDRAVGYFTSLGIPAAGLMVPFVAGTEFLCGALILVGCFTRVAAVPLVVIMAVAILVAKRLQMAAFMDVFGMNEFLYLVMLTALFVEGAGRFSVDALLVKRSSKPEGRILRAA